MVGGRAGSMVMGGAGASHGERAAMAMVASLDTTGYHVDITGYHVDTLDTTWISLDTTPTTSRISLDTSRLPIYVLTYVHKVNPGSC